MSGKPYILGLDLGTNSIGWAVVDCEIEKTEDHQGIYAGYKPVSLRALNSRIFEDMLEAKTKVPKNQKRRAMRGARNRRAYYQQRRQGLVEILLENNLLPEEYSQAPEKTLNEIDRRYAVRKLGKPWSKTWTLADKAYCSPYAMRNFALEEKLEPYELGRLLLHLQRRRGYFSNRGAKYIELIKSLKLETPEDDDEALSDEEKKETGKVLAAIDQLSKALDGRTLGQFVWQKSQEEDLSPQRVTLFEFEQSKVRKGEEVIERLQFRAQREMYEEEFDRIWKKQNEFHKLDGGVSQKIKDKIFHQRPLQLQKSTVGNCNIYPRRKRGAMMRLEFQEFRTLQVINNIIVGEKPLTEEQRNTLLQATNDPAKLNDKGRISWKEAAQILGVKHKDINYNRGGDDGEGKSGLFGNRTAQAISRSIGVNAWRKLDHDQQIKLVEDLLTIHNKKTLYQRLVGHWKFRPYQQGDDLTQGALGLAMNEQLEEGYGKHSIKAIKELLPHMRKGADYYVAMEKIGKRESITKEIRGTEGIFLLDHGDIPNIANPIVQKALFEVRRVVNAIVKRYGKPAIIRMEMARDMKSSKKHRKEVTTQQKANRKANEDAEKEILKWRKDGNVSLDAVRGGLRRVSPKDRQKYKMWKEQEEKCPYCQKQIGFNELFSGAAEIEHILPYTGFRQSYMNTVLSCQTCNATKGKKTPYEAWGSDQKRWEKIKIFAEKTTTVPYPKRKNILKKEHFPENEDDFVKRQLNDTRYIATAVKKVLEEYGARVDVNNGGATSELRQELGLNNVLPRDPDSGPYEIDKETGELLRYSAAKAEKSRRDHRHHAVDAFVVAITDRAMLQTMIKTHQKEQDDKTLSRSRTKEEDEIKEKRWKSILSKKLNATVVSHMTKRKVWGALHEETLYGKSHFEQPLNIESMRPNVLWEVQKIAEVEANGEEPWIADEKLRAILSQWAKETQNREPTDRALPDWEGKKLREFIYKTPCLTIRKELNGELLSKLSEEWKPGKGTWVAEKSVHNALYQWLKAHNLVDEKAKAIDAKLKETPPRIINKQGQPGAVIRRVRMARVLTDSYVKIANSHVRPGNNHHFVLFHNGKEGKDKERRFQVVTMLEAAKRASAKKPVVDKEPPPEWDGEWRYELHLCVNDMVRCEDLSIFDDEKRFANEHRDTPYFRVQRMSKVGKSLQLYLRHHSISGTDSDWGLWRIVSLKNIKCKRAQPGVLGLLLDDSQNDRDRF